MRLYHYVGPADIRQRTVGHSERWCVRQWEDVRQWLTHTEPVASRRSYVPATYIVDPQQQLWLADRRSEHVACAGGGEVLAAGEIVLAQHRERIEVIEASNQSTGYCPEPECWIALTAVLERLKIPYPPGFTASFEFRRCDRCGTINLIKDDTLECAVCRAELSIVWNCGEISKVPDGQ